MTNRAQITRQAARDGVPAPTVERDYVLAHIIAALGAIDASHGPQQASRSRERIVQSSAENAANPAAVATSPCPVRVAR